MIKSCLANVHVIHPDHHTARSQPLQRRARGGFGCLICVRRARLWARLSIWRAEKRHCSSRRRSCFQTANCFCAHTLDCLCWGVPGWPGALGLWAWEAGGVHPPLVLLQQFASPLGLSLHGSAVALPVSTAVSCTKGKQQKQEEEEEQKKLNKWAAVLNLKLVLK